MHKIINTEELVDKFVQEEKALEPNSFIATRVMAAVSGHRPGHAVRFAPVWRMAIAVVVLVAAVFTGIAAGNMYNTGAAGTNAVVINDDAMEHFGFYSAAPDE